MAKLAEPMSIHGPRHVLDLAAQLGLTLVQKKAVTKDQSLFFVCKNNSSTRIRLRDLVPSSFTGNEIQVCFSIKRNKHI